MEKGHLKTKNLKQKPSWNLATIFSICTAHIHPVQAPLIYL